MAVCRAGPPPVAVRPAATGCAPRRRGRPRGRRAGSGRGGSAARGRRPDRAPRPCRGARRARGGRRWHGRRASWRSWCRARGRMRHRPAVGNPGSRDGPAVEGPCRSGGGVERGAHRGVQPPPHAPARAREREVRDGGEARARRARSASRRCAMRSPRRQLGVVDAHAVAVDAPAAGPHEQRAGRPDEPDAERRRARARARSARAGRAPRGRRGRRAARRTRRSAPAGALDALGPTTFAPRCAYSSGITQACAKLASVTGSASGWTANSSAARADERDDVRRSSSRSTARRCGRRRSLVDDAAASGRPGAPAAPRAVSRRPRAAAVVPSRPRSAGA